MTADDDVDVIVIGGGLAGLCALNAALEGGCTARLIEKTNALGGSTVLSSGLVALTGTDEQASHGVVDSLELLRQDLTETGRGHCNSDLIDVYCREQLDTYRWMQSLGIQFGAPHAGSGQSVPRSHPIDTWNAIQTLARQARSLGAMIDVGVHARRLVTDGPRVVGVVVDERTKSREITARAAVLASGGFSRSEKMLRRFAPAMSRALRAGGEGNTGDGLLMASKIGAGLADLAFVKGTFGIFPFRSAAEEGTGILAVYKGAIVVNGYGERFINESLPYKILGDACLAQPESIAFQIFDSTTMECSDSAVAIYNFKRRLEAGQVVQAGSVSELAEKLGIDVEPLVATVRRYNEAVSSGASDAFGRSTLVGGVGRPRPIEIAPFYGFPSTTVVLATYCGVTFDEQTRVTDVYGDVIDGLYAAGEVTGGFHGDGYVTGSSLGKSAIFGRVAGREAAQSAKGQK